MDPSALFQAASPSIYMLAVLDADGEIVGNGSGFAVSTAGVLATNSHVVQHAGANFVAVSSSGTRVSVLGLLADDPGHDLALIKIDSQTSPLPLAPNESVSVGQQTYLIGASRGLEQSLSVGLVSAIRQTLPESLQSSETGKQGPFVQHTATSAPGSSGSPILDQQGRVIGVHHSGLRGDGILFAAHVSLLRDLLAATDLSAPPQRLGPNVTRNLVVSAAIFGVPLLGYVIARFVIRRRRRRPMATIH